MEIIFDVETSNHLKNDCDGDKKLLKFGMAGVLPLEGETTIYFEEKDIDTLNRVLESSEAIIGFNLSGGFDYTVLENYGIDTKGFREKTIDLMPYLIQAFGSNKNFNLDNILEHTLGKTKMKLKARYKLVRSDPGRLKIGLDDELKLIRELYVHIQEGKLISFKNKSGFIDEFEVLLAEGVDCPSQEEMVDHYEMPFVGFTLEIKDVSKTVVRCKKCRRQWSITSRSYFGDTMRDTVHCPKCSQQLAEVSGSLMGPDPEVREIPVKKRKKKE